MTDIKNTGARILIVEDDGIITLHLKNILTRLGYNVVGLAATGEEVLQMIKQVSPDLVLMDINLAGEMTGIETVAQIQTRFDIPVIYSTGYPDKMLWEEAKVTEPFGYLIKPFQERELRTVIEMALYRHKLESRLKESEERYRILSELTSDFAYSIHVAPDGTLALEWMTDAFTHITGFTIEEARARGGCQSMIHPDDLTDGSQRFQTLLAGQPDVSEFRIVTKSGKVRWLRVHGRPIWDETQGRVVRIYSVAQDITERKQTEEALRESEELYSNIVESMNDGIVVLDHNFQYTHWNRAMERISKVPREELIGSGKCPWDVFPHLSEQGVDEMMRQAMRGEVAQQEDIPYHLPDGTGGFTSEVYLPLLSASGEIRGVVGVIHDITERKRTEETLQESEERFRSVFEDSAVGMLLMDQNNRYIKVNRAISKILGYSQQELLSMGISDITLPGEVDQSGDIVGQLWNGESDGFTTEKRYLHHDGHIGWSNITVSPIRDAEGKTVYTLVQLQDISERKQVEEDLHVHQIELEMQNQELRRAQLELSESRDRYSDLYNFTPLGYFTIGKNKLILEANLTSATMLGLERARLLKLPLSHFIVREDQDIYYAYYQKLIGTQTQQFCQIRMVKKDGSQFYGQLEGITMLDNEGEVVQCRMTMSDITERKQVEKALQESEKRFRTLTESAHVAIGISRQGNVTYVNQAFLHTFGYNNLAEVQNTPVLNYIAPHRHQEIIETIRRREQGEAVPETYETSGQRKDNSQFPLYVQSCRLTLPNGPALLGFFEDISERVQAEEQLKTALTEKEMLLKEVYHRVKNNLTVLEYLIDMQAENVEVPQVLDALAEIQGRIKAIGLIHQKLYQAKDLAQIDFGEYLKDMTNNLFHALAGNRPISLRVEAESIFIKANLAIPCGLIVNELVTNAFKYAFPPGPPSIPPRGGEEKEGTPRGGKEKEGHPRGGEEKEGHPKEEGEIRVAFELQKDGYVLTVSDNGVGLPPGLDWQTTESLGLRLINMWTRHQLGGSIEVETGRDQKTVFKITFGERSKRS